MPARRGNKDAKRKQILEASRDVFSQCGYHAARVEDIAHRAGVGKGTVYEYFPSKEELYQEMVLQVADDYIAELARGLQGRGTPLEKLEKMAYRHFSFLVRHGQLARVATESPGPVSEKLRVGLDRVRLRVAKEVSSLMQAGIDEGALRPIDPRVATRLLLSGLAGVVVNGVMNQETVDDQDFADAFQTFLHGIRAGAEDKDETDATWRHG